MHRSVGAAVLIGVMLSGCASITKGTTQSVAITTAPITGASCKVANGKGNWSVTTPGTVVVAKSVETLAVTCSKQGYQDATATIAPKMQPESVASIVFAGPVGVFVDAQTGAINRYPDSVTLSMMELPPLPAPAAK